MIVSASRRTDIPACYAPWLIERLKAGYALTSNPYSGKLTRVDLTRGNVDILVLWTKNPLPLLSRLDELNSFGIPYYIEYTITAYGRDIEPNLPSLDERLDAFDALSDRLGAARVDWRFDPIFINRDYPLSRVCDAFYQIENRLYGKTERCVISFLDAYRHLSLQEPTDAEKLAIAAALQKSRIPLFTCAEEIDLSAFGIGRAACVDGEKIMRILGRQLHFRKDPNQRPACGCANSVDIGAYDSCGNECAYCYANHSLTRARNRRARHDPMGETLIPPAIRTPD